MPNEENIPLLDKLIVPIIMYLLGILTPYIKRTFYKSETFKCAFKHPKIFESPKYYEVKFYKCFGKTYKSDCPWFDLHKMSGYKNLKHPYCPFGEDIKQVEGTNVGICPYSNLKITGGKI